MATGTHPPADAGAPADSAADAGAADDAADGDPFAAPNAGLTTDTRSAATNPTKAARDDGEVFMTPREFVTDRADSSYRWAVSSWWIEGDVPRGSAYDARFERLEAAGANVHGEADLVTVLLAACPAPRVLDAGCGTGRVAIELDRRGMKVTGVDLDPAMLDAARAKRPDLAWVGADLADLDNPAVELTGPFDLAIAAGNVMIFVAPGSQERVVAALAHQLMPGGLLLAGFQLKPGSLAAYDAACDAAGLALVDRWSTWDRQPWRVGGDYAVSLHSLGTSRFEVAPVS